MDMRIDFRITETADPADMGRLLEPKMRNLGNAIGRRAQRTVPKRTWALHDTIAVETKRTGGVVTTRVSAGGSAAPYALYVERGTSKMRAQPYLRPALLQSRAGDFKNEQPLGKTKSVRRAEAKQRAADRRMDKRTAAQESASED